MSPKPTDFVPFGDTIEEFLFGPSEGKAERMKEKAKQETPYELVGLILPGFKPTTKLGKTILKRLGRHAPEVALDEMPRLGHELYPKAIRTADGKVHKAANMMQHHAEIDRKGSTMIDEGYFDETTGEFQSYMDYDDRQAELEEIYERIQQLVESRGQVP